MKFYKKNDDVLLTEQDEEAIVLHMGSEKYYSLNKVALLIYKQIMNQDSKAQIISKIIGKFKKKKKTANNDFDKVVADMLEKEILLQDKI